MKNIVKGAIFYADLDPIIGSEQQGIRPVVIIQNEMGNKHSPTVLVAPISTKKDKILPTHILVKQFDKIRHDSIVLLEQIRVLDKSRLKGYLGILDNETIEQVNEAIKISFELK